MALFLLGLAIFLGSHLFVGLARGPRAALIAKLGTFGFKGLFAVVAILGLTLTVLGWQQAGPGTPFYVAPGWLYHLTYLLVWVAFVLAVSAYLPAGKIAGGTKHPLLAAIKFWALAHLLVNGDARSLILFLSVLAWAVIARIAAKKRGDNGRPAGSPVNDLIAVVIGTVGYLVVFFWLHRYIAGVALH